MKNFIFMLAIAIAFAGYVTSARADSSCTVLTPCGNGSPENVVNVWGTTNSQLPHIKPGQTINGVSCPFWFPMDCVDISNTSYFISRWGSK